MHKFTRRAVAFAVAIFAFALNAFAYEPPPVTLSSSTFPAWRDSNRLLIVTNCTTGGMDITLLIEKPVDPGVYWSVFLNLCDGTNTVAQLAVGDELMGKELLELTGAKVTGVKTVQRFWLSVSSNALPQSTLTFTQHKRLARPFEFGNLVTPAIVPLQDLIHGATGGFREGEPLFPGRS
jgi:hypothetical protein